MGVSSDRARLFDMSFQRLDALVRYVIPATAYSNNNAIFYWRRRRQWSFIIIIIIRSTFVHILTDSIEPRKK
jgi:hypothetical protein